jgi:hypothetical protein
MQATVQPASIRGNVFLHKTTAGTSLYSTKYETQGTYKCRYIHQSTEKSWLQLWNNSCVDAHQTWHQEWRYLKWGLHNTVFHVAHNCFHNFANGYINTLPTRRSWTTVSGPTMSHTHESTYMTSTTLTLSTDNHYAIHKHDDQAHFYANIWADIIRDTVMVLSATKVCWKQFYWAV